MLTLSGLGLGPEDRYIAIICHGSGSEPDFHNYDRSLIELYDKAGKKIPFTCDEGVLSSDRLSATFEKFAILKYGRLPSPPDFQLPSVDGPGPYIFDRGTDFAQLRFLDGEGPRAGYIAVALGNNEDLPSLHPIHTEVREYWLGQLKSVIDAGVDGVDVRVANHSTWTREGLAFGFNDIIVSEFEKRYGVDIRCENFDVEKWRRLQGEYYTRFLWEARALAEESGIPLQLHVNALMGATVPGCNRNNVPMNFSWDWRAWIEEGIADSILLKYIPWPFGGSVPEVDEFGQKVVDVANRAGVEVFVELRVSGEFESGAGPSEKLRHVIDWSNASAGVTGVVLYEAANFVTIDPITGDVTMYEPVLDLIRESLQIDRH